MTTDFGKFAFDTIVAITRAHAVGLGLPDPLPSAPKAVSPFSVENFRPPAFVRCPACGGSGIAVTYTRGQDQAACRDCDGSGQVIAATGEAR